MSDHSFSHADDTAFLVLIFGAAVAFYEGINHVLHPSPMHDPLANYLVIGASFLFEGGSWWVGAWPAIGSNFQA